MPLPQPILIEFDRVGISFDHQPVLEDVSFQVRRGETKVLLGETGAGKSVALKLALGLLRPDTGVVEVLGERVSSLPEEQLFALRRRIGMVFQESALFDSLTVRENVAYRLNEEGQLDADAIEARVRACLAMVDLEEAIDKMPAELSGGMQRRVSIARALSTEPEVMLYDSPTGGLDPITATNIMEQIIKLRDVNRVTALLVTHRLQDGFLMATHRWDRERNQLVWAPDHDAATSFLVLHEHHIIFNGAADALLASSDPYLRHFLQS
ncbi:MAG: ATP-binding cassette domain-containing protein [Acidobacteria bacterium]|nr:MAG: ATP-binding cassette domain-containing protein [Acidobacteriota bacterium]